MGRKTKRIYRRYRIVDRRNVECAIDRLVAQQQAPVPTERSAEQDGIQNVLQLAVASAYVIEGA